MMYKFFAISVALCSLLGCALSVAPLDYKLDSHPGEGFVIVGLHGMSSNYYLSIQKYDPNTNVKIKGLSTIKSFHNSHILSPAKLEYRGGAFAAGDYFISKVTVSDFSGKDYVYPKYSYAMTFSVKPGQILYLGEFSTSFYGALKHKGFVPEKAKELLEKYPYVNGEINNAIFEHKSITHK